MVNFLLMRIFTCLFIALAVFYASPIHAQVVINEVHVKPAPNATGADIQSLKVCAQPTYGTEFIELYNADPCIPADISCYILASSAFSSATNGSFRFPSGTTIQPQGHISIGGPNSGATFNLTNYCGDPHLLTGNDRWYLANGDMYLALYDDQGNPVNAVFWTSNPGEATKWGTDSDLDDAPQHIPNGVSCPTVAALPMPNGVVDYAGGSPAMGNSLSRSTDGASNWAELTPSINNCNDGNCVPNSSFGVSAVVNQPSCGMSDGSIALTPDVAGTYTYTWTPNVSSTSSANNLGGATYQIHVSDGFCSWDTTITLTIPVPFEVTANVNQPPCYGGEGNITLTPNGTGPYTYSWNPNVSSSGTATNLSSGSYQINIDDGNCQWDSTITISDPSEISFSTGSEPAPCPSIQTGLAYVYNLHGGTGILNISWSSPTSNSDTIYNLASGIYAFEITDENGCKKNGTVNVGEGIGPTVTTDQANYTDCPGEVIEVVAGGASTYEINDPTEFSMGSQSNRFLSEETTQGTFWMVGTDVYGCKDSVQFDITRHGAPHALTFDINKANCNQSDGQVVVAQVFGGSPSYTYNLNAGAYQGSNSFTNLRAGTYTIGIEDANGCRFDSIANVGSTSGPTAVFTSTTNTTCTNEDGVIVIDSVHGGIQPYEYAINSGAFTSNTTYSSLDSGIYTVAVKDVNGCTFSVPATVGITPSVSGFTISMQPEICGRNNGSIKVETISGGTAPYSFSIDGITFQPDSSFINQEAEQKNITIKDGNGCTYDSLITIPQLTAPVASISSHNDPKCFNSSDGDALGTATGGNGTISYVWKDTAQSVIATTPQLTALQHGTYKLVVSDTNHCLDSSTVILNNPTPIAIAISKTPTGCNADNGTATASATGGTGNLSYSWDTSPVQNTATATGLGSTTPYKVTVTDQNGCTHDTTINIQTLNAAQISFVSESPITCADSSNGSIITTIAGGTKPYTLSWNTTPTQTDTIATHLGAGTHTLTVTDAANCVATFSRTLTAPDIIKATLSAVDDTCGQGIGSVTAVATGGTGNLQYQWDDPNYQTTATATGLLANGYSVTVTDNNSCYKTFSVTVHDTPGPNITSITRQNVNCEGGSDGAISVTANGGTSLNYNWKKLPLPSPIISTSATVNNIDTGRYVITVTDNSGCSIDSTITIGFDNPIPVFSLPADTAFCEEDSVILFNNSTADSYLWFPTGETTQQIYAKTAGEYRLKITRNGCSYEDTMQVSEDRIPPLDLGVDSVFCGSVLITLDITVSGTPQYVWKDGNNNPIRTLTIPDEYWAQISRNTCLVSDTVLFTEQPETQVSLPPDQTLCEGEQYTIVPTLANAQNPQYSWNNSATTEQITVTQTNEYILTVTDEKCIKKDTIKVTFLEQPVVNLGPDTTICENETLTMRATHNNNFTVQWNTGSTAMTEQTNTAGLFWAEVQNQICTDRDSINVTIQALPVFDLGADTTVCKGEWVTFGVSLFDVNYQWNTLETTSHITVDEEGMYQLVVTENGCSTQDEVWLYTRNLPIAPIEDVSICLEDTIEIDAYCSNCVSYLWGNGDTRSVQQVFRPGKKQVMVTDVFGCQNTKQIFITEDKSPECEPGFYVPNTFTPNGDGHNELFLPITRTELLQEYELEIYNRWGELIFSTTNPTQSWDGRYMGNLVQSGIYSWKIRYKLQERAARKQIFGHINVLR